MVVALVILGLLTNVSDGSQGTFDVRELAEYRLSTPVLKQFQEASRLIAVIARDDSELGEKPLFTREIAVSGDAAVVAAQLAARLESHPRLAAALRTANMTAREYTKFALALLAARLAHGFVKAGVLRSVPAGVAADNVQFVDVHDATIGSVLEGLGLEGPASQIDIAMQDPVAGDADLDEATMRQTSPRIPSGRLQLNGVCLVYTREPAMDAAICSGRSHPRVGVSG